MIENTEVGVPTHQQEEELHPDVIAFCALLARIMNRCLKEQDPRIIALLQADDPTTAPAVQEGEVSHAA